MAYLILNIIASQSLHALIQNVENKKEAVRCYSCSQHCAQNKEKKVKYTQIRSNTSKNRFLFSTYANDTTTHSHLKQNSAHYHKI